MSLEDNIVTYETHIQEPCGCCHGGPSAFITIPIKPDSQDSGVTIGMHKTGVQTWRVCRAGSRAYTLARPQNLGFHVIWAGMVKQRNCQVLSRVS